MITAGRSLVSARVDRLRAQFPVFERVSYLNAGTNGPVPRRAVDAVAEALRRQVEDGRGDREHFEWSQRQIEALRERIAAVLGCDLPEVALTGSTGDGINAVLGSLDLGPGDEVLTGDDEHPAVLAPLGALRERRGVSVRTAPLDELPEAVGPRTRLVACSHVSWMTGSIVDARALAATDALVLLDGAQALGAIAVDVRELGCDFYAASGQKWLCGPNGIGYLYVRAGLASTLHAPWPGFVTLAAPERALELELHPDARRLSVGYPPPHQTGWALASLDVLEEADMAAVQARAADLAASFAARLGERVRPRGRSTLVSWEAADPEAQVARLRNEGFVIRYLPGAGAVRASVGAWSTEDELERLAELATARG